MVTKPPEDSASFLFQCFFSCFPFTKKGKLYEFSPFRLTVYFFILIFFFSGNLSTFFIHNLPWETSYIKIMFYSSNFTHSISYFLSIVGLSFSRKIINLPFLHLELGVAYLRASGLSPRIKYPVSEVLLAYLMPFLMYFQEFYLTLVNTYLWYFWAFFNYLNFFFVYQLLFRVLGCFNILKNLFRFEKHSLALIGNSINYSGKTEKIVSLIHTHSHLCSSCLYLNEIFSIALLSAITTAFIGSTVGLFLMFLLNDIGLNSTLVCKLLFSKACQVLCFLLLTGYLVHTCYRCGIEAKEFNTLLYQLMIDDKTNEILNNQKLRLHIAMKREVVFTACGFFTLDYTLVHSMIASATTYLVILIQFGQPTSVPPSPLQPDVLNFTTTQYPLLLSSTT